MASKASYVKMTKCHWIKVKIYLPTYNIPLKSVKFHIVPGSTGNPALSLHHLPHASRSSGRFNVTTAGEMLDVRPSVGNQVTRTSLEGIFDHSREKLPWDNTTFPLYNKHYLHTTVSFSN